MAEREREAISSRTKAALAAAKARGTKLGKPKGTLVQRSDVGRINGSKANPDKATAFAERMRPVLAKVPGLSARAAAELASRGCATARGGKWSATQVIAVRKRLGRLRDPDSDIAGRLRRDRQDAAARQHGL